MKSHFKQSGIQFLILNCSPILSGCATLLVILTSCSVQKQIAKSAKADVLDAKALQTAHVGISIFDPAANKYLYNYQGDKYFVPASNTKLPTCYAAMKYLGDSLVGLRYRFYSLWSGGSSRSEKEEKVCEILPSADPTFLHPDFNSQNILNFFKTNSDKTISIYTNWIWHATPLGEGWSWDDYEASYMTERSPFPAYGNVVHFKKQADSIPVIHQDSTYPRPHGVDVYPKYFKQRLHAYPDKGLNTSNMKITRSLILNSFDIRYSKGTFNTVDVPYYTNFLETSMELLRDTIGVVCRYGLRDKEDYKDETIGYTGGGKILDMRNGVRNVLQFRKQFYELHSQPTDSLLKPMMHNSDNFFAEQSLLMVSNEMLGVMNDEKIIDTLLKTDFKDLPQKPRWTDGSGLSRYNLFTPQDFVTILNKMKNEFGMERIKVILPTGGEGTISNYYKTDSGYIYAKTGTLSGVVAFSGFLYTKKGKLLIFSTLVNNHQATATEVRKAVEKFLQGVRTKY
jgi:D-alanyl-D-alanine carboxypeptidase/D-alanyl-D-alanine-endopeptidase (penicillin-binding protein 4)